MGSLVKGELAPQELAPQELAPKELDMGLSIINMNPIDVVEKLGKYEFIYDYNAVPMPIMNMSNYSTVLENQQVSNQVAIPQPVTISNSSAWGDIVKQEMARSNINFGNTLNSYNYTQPVSVNANPQVGVFSKGNVVNVIRFEGSNAIIENPNYVALETTNVKPSWISLFQNVMNKSELMIPKEYLMKVKDNFPVTTQTGINFGANLKPQPVKTQPVYVEPNYAIPYVKPKPYLVVQDFIIYSRWENRMGQSGVQELPYLKGSVILLPTATFQDQFDIALKGGKLQELPIVSVVSLVDKQIGKCNPSLSQMQQMDYNPCRTVKKGETLIGYIANGVFTNTNQDIMKPELSIGEYELLQTNDGSSIQTNSGAVVPVANDNNNLFLIAGAFILGYALFSNDKSE